MNALLRILGCFFISFVLTQSGSATAQVKGKSGQEPAQQITFSEFLQTAAVLHSRAGDASSAYLKLMAGLTLPDGLALAHTTTLSTAHRFSQQEVDQFERNYRLYLGAILARAPKPDLDAKAQAAFGDLLVSRSTISRSMYDLAPLNVVPIIDTLNRDSVEVRPRQGIENTYLLAMGADFLERLDQSILKSCFYITQLFVGDHRPGINGIPWSLSDMLSKADFVDLAPQIDPRNHARASLLLPGGAERTQYDLMLAGMATLDRLRSNTVPLSVKKTILWTPLLAGVDHDDESSASSPDELFAYYLNPEPALKGMDPKLQSEFRRLIVETPPYVAALHYYMLRDVLDYLTLHELAHVQQKFQNASFSTAVLREADADNQALIRIVHSQTTDARAIVLAMAAFIADYNYWGEGDSDPNHPFPAARLALIRDLSIAIEPGLLLDLQTGLESLRQSVPEAKASSAGIKEVRLAQRFDHQITLDLAFDSAHSALGNGDERFGVKLTVAAYHALEPSKDVALGTFTGDVTLTGERNVLIGGKDRDRRAKINLTLPPELWTTCVDCGIRVKSLSILKVSAGAPHWEGIGEAPDVLLKRIADGALSNDLRGYSYVYLARGLLSEGRRDAAAQVYAKIPVNFAAILTPEDYLHWSAAIAMSDPAKAASLLKDAQSQFPLSPALGYAAGLLAEQGQDFVAAVDGYFHELFSSSTTEYQEAAQLRMMGLPAMEGRIPREYALGLYQYYLAQKTRQVTQFNEASAHFKSVFADTGSKSARVYQAETMMYASMLSKQPAIEARALFQQILSDDRYFIPAYVHLFQIDACAKNYDTAVKWLQDALEIVPLTSMEMLDSAVAAVDSGQLKTIICSEESQR
jgi:tetratricopeptide (TPR) repeat protein